VFSWYSLPALFLLGACTTSGYIDGGDADPEQLTCGRVRTETIDRGAVLDGIEPGKSVGAFVEYAGEGLWRVVTTCDTLESNLSCYWDVIVTSKAGLEKPLGEDLETDDYIDPFQGDGLRLSAYTDEDIDGFTFLATPGDIVEFDAFLDDTCQPDFVYWIGDGEAQRGAPSNPVRFEPSKP